MPDLNIMGKNLFKSFINDLPDNADQIKMFSVARFHARSDTTSLEGSSILKDFEEKKIDHYMKGASAPFLYVLDLDALITTYGNNVLEDLLVLRSRSMERNESIVLTAAGGIKLKPALRNMLSIHCKFELIDDTPVIYGEKPYTTLFSIAANKDNELTPLV